MNYEPTGHCPLKRPARVCVFVYLGFYRRVSFKYDYSRLGTDF